MAIFKGAGVAIVTPMYDNEEVNYDKLEELINMQIDNILHNRHLYMSADFKKPGLYAEKYRAKAIEQNKGIQLPGKDELEL